MPKSPVISTVEFLEWLHMGSTRHAHLLEFNFANSSSGALGTSFRHSSLNEMSPFCGLGQDALDTGR